MFGEFAEGVSPDWKHGERNFADVQAGYFYEVTGSPHLKDVENCYQYSMVFSRMTYKMFAEGIGTKKLGELTFRTLLMMTGNDTFRDFGTLMEINAKQMLANGTLSDKQFEIVTTALTNAGIRGEMFFESVVDQPEDHNVSGNDTAAGNETVIA